MAKTYDAVAYRLPWAKELQDLLRPFELEEKQASVKRFGNLRFGITFFKSGTPSGGWPEVYVRDLPILGLRVAARSYAKAPELLAEDFTWEPVTEFGTTKQEDNSEAPNVWGGTLKDATKRT